MIQFTVALVALTPNLRWRIGGVIGCFVGGRIAKEDVVVGIGASLGIGLVNGFVVGTAVGLVLGLLR